MYNNSFWDTIRGQQLASDISILAQCLNRRTEQKTIRLKTAADLVFTVEYMIANGWRYIDVINLSEEVTAINRSDRESDFDRYLLIMEKEL